LLQYAFQIGADFSEWHFSNAGRSLPLELVVRVSGIPSVEIPVTTNDPFSQLRAAAKRSSFRARSAGVIVEQPAKASKQNANV